eukprot:TRINITY_DN2171_c0_g1_i6.p1 TRINITY_DN2171_c0_g1~~TRINITY_DN2171_c0_g1_i6.p1  ORF type:complete len:312 (+),score=50.19 TRINITY_DN2171_c0_g1_i6:30-965(+)
MDVVRVQEDSTSSISQEEVISAYRDLLVDINTCLQLCKSLETERTYREMVSDWAAGQRGNIPRMVKLMEDLKKEVEKGLCLFMSLSHKLNDVKLLKSCVSDNLKHYGVILTDIFLRFNSAVASLQNVGILKCKKAINSIAKNVALSSAAIAGGLLLPRGVDVVYMLGMLAHIIARYDGAKRGIKYTELQSLFESLDNPIMMSLETAHFTIENLIEELDTLMEKYKAGEKEIKEITFKKDSMQGVIRATKIFVETEKEELEELALTEPDMSEGNRKKIARRAAVRNCKTFLKEKLQYSNAEADEVINNILQN